MPVKRNKFFVSIFLIMLLCMLNSIIIFADTPSFFVENSKYFIKYELEDNKHPFLTDSSFADIGYYPMTMYIDIVKQPTFNDNHVETHLQEVILKRDVKLVLYNGKGYAPFTPVDNPDKLKSENNRFLHDKILWCEGYNFGTLADALSTTEPTKKNGTSNVPLVGDYDDLSPRTLQFCINKNISNINSCTLQVYDCVSGNLLDSYSIKDLSDLTYDTYDEWAKEQSFSNKKLVRRSMGMEDYENTSVSNNETAVLASVLADSEAPDGIAVTKEKNEEVKESYIKITDKTAITNKNGEVIGVEITMDYAVESSKEPYYIRCCDPSGEILYKVPITDRKGTVKQEFSNLVDDGTEEKPYTVRLITRPNNGKEIKDSFTYTNTSLERDNTWSDHIPVISYTGLTGVPTYPRNTKVPITIVTDVPATIKVNGKTIVANGNQAVYNVTKNGEINLMAEANGQFAETTVSVNEFTEDVVEVDDSNAINSDGDILDKATGTVYDKNGNVKGLADGNGNIVDKYGNKIGSYGVSGNASSKEGKIDEGEKLTQTGIYTPIVFIGFILLVLGVIILYGGKKYEHRNN